MPAQIICIILLPHQMGAHISAMQTCHVVWYGCAQVKALTDASLLNERCLELQRSKRSSKAPTHKALAASPTEGVRTHTHVCVCVCDC